MLMFLTLFALWIILNGKFTWEICGIGLIITGLVYLFCWYALGYHPSHERKFLKRAFHYLGYFFMLIFEILKANISVMKVILSPKAEYTPAIRKIHVDLKKNSSRVLLSNSITLTPGTVTVDQKDDEYTVLCLQKESADDIPEWNLVRKLKKLEEEGWN